MLSDRLVIIGGAEFSTGQTVTQTRAGTTDNGMGKQADTPDRDVG